MVASIRLRDRIGEILHAGDLPAGAGWLPVSGTFVDHLGGDVGGYALGQPVENILTGAVAVVDRMAAIPNGRIVEHPAIGSADDLVGRNLERFARR